MTDLLEFLRSTGAAHLAWRELVMIGVACLLLWLAIVKQWEPLLLVPIGFGALLANLPLSPLTLAPDGGQLGGLFHYLSYGLRLEILPPLVLFGFGALTDFGPLLANPRTLLLGGAAQLGIFGAFLGASALGFSPADAASVGVVGGVDVATSIYFAMKLAPHLVAPIAVTVLACVALVPVIQPILMRALTTEDERRIRMDSDFDVPRSLRVAFPVVVTIVVALLVPAITPLIGALMFGNLLRECGVTERLTRSAQNEVVNIGMIVLGISVGASMAGETVLQVSTAKIVMLGLVALVLSTMGGVLCGKLMARLPGRPINPLIGAAGVSAIPSAARVVDTVGLDADPENPLLIHAMGPSAAGLIGTAIAAGALLSFLS